MTPSYVVPPTRIQGLGWTALRVGLFLAQICGIWFALGLKPGPLTTALIGSSEAQVAAWVMVVLAALFGLWKMVVLLVHNAAQVVHSGRSLHFDVSWMVTGTLGLSLALAACAPFTGRMFPLLAAALLLSLAGNFLDDMAVTLDAEMAAEAETATADDDGGGKGTA